MCLGHFFFFKQKTAYEMRISDWSSDVCSSDARPREAADARADDLFGAIVAPADEIAEQIAAQRAADAAQRGLGNPLLARHRIGGAGRRSHQRAPRGPHHQLARTPPAPVSFNPSPPPPHPNPSSLPPYP